MTARPLTVPPLAVLLGLLGLPPSAHAVPPDEQRVTLPFAVLRLLLRGALACQPFDEEGYLKHNPDVASAVLRGDVASGQEHHAADGYFEGRVGGCDAFAETWYVNQNQDVAAAIRAGTFASGRDHYDRVGKFELRSPNPSADADMALWRACRPPRAAPPAEASEAGPNTPIELDSIRRRLVK
jgi:hypothetical protein